MCIQSIREIVCIISTYFTQTYLTSAVDTWEWDLNEEKYHVISLHLRRVNMLMRWEVTAISFPMFLSPALYWIFSGSYCIGQCTTPLLPWFNIAVDPMLSDLKKCGIHGNKQTKKQANTHAHRASHTHTHTHTHRCMHAHTDAHRHTEVHTHTQTHASTHIPTWTHTHTHTHTHRVYSFSPESFRLILQIGKTF